MAKYRLRAISAALAVTALTLTGCAAKGGTGDPASSVSEGITNTTVTLGTSTALSGPLSAYADETYGEEAYFDYLNATQGGVKMADGKTRKINFVVLDDAFNPSQALANVKQLVTQDNVFAIYGQFGGDTALAAAPYLNEQQIPQLFATGGADALYNTKTYPYTVPFFFKFSTAATLVFQAIHQLAPGKKVAFLYSANGQADDFNTPFLACLAQTGTPVVKQAEQPTEADVAGQMAVLARSDAPVFVNWNPNLQTLQGLKEAGEDGWTPGIKWIYDGAADITSVLDPAGQANSQNVYVWDWAKDPAEPSLADDPAVKIFNYALRKYVANKVSSLHSGLAFQGMASAAAMVAVLERSQPNRQSLNYAAHHLDNVANPFFLPGVTMKTTPTNVSLFSDVQLLKYSGDGWQSIGKPVSTDVNGCGS